MPPRYCPQCATPLAFGPVAGRERPHCPNCGFVIYRNPAPVAMAVVEHEGRLLLICRANAPLAHYWAPPAGYVEIDETVPAAAAREAHEEAGVTVAIDGLLNVYSASGAGVLIVAYRGRVTGGEPRAGEDALEARYFAPADLPAQAPPPPDSPLLDVWFYGALQDLLMAWKAGARKEAE